MGFITILTFEKPFLLKWCFLKTEILSVLYSLFCHAPLKLKNAIFVFYLNKQIKNISDETSL